MADDSMRYVHTLAIVLNCWNDSDLYEKLYSKLPIDPEYLEEPEMKIETIKGSEYIKYEISNKQRAST
jgi:hypothetical protein